MDEQECRRILEVSADASLEDITHAYHTMKRIYEGEHSLFIVPSMDEFSPEARSAVIEEIETAYRELCRIRAEAKPQIHTERLSIPEADRPIDGKTLRSLREAAGVTLDYISSQTHVRLEYLTALEEDRFWDLPPAAVNVRGFLSMYAAEIGLPVERIVPAYMDRFQKWQTRRVK
jgi:hypothetical protein